MDKDMIERRKDITFATLNTQLAVVVTNTEGIKEDIKEIKLNNKAMEKRMRDAEKEIKSGCDQANMNKEEIDRLRNKSDIWNSFNSLAVMIAGILGIDK